MAGEARELCVFVLVGDHTPPFVNPNLRNQFSGTVVPYIILIPQNPASRQPAASIP
jgi:phosphoglycerol transferase MdoB-like AlkP superfamily enzyme